MASFLFFFVFTLPRRRERATGHRNFQKRNTSPPAYTAACLSPSGRKINSGVYPSHPTAATTRRVFVRLYESVCSACGPAATRCRVNVNIVRAFRVSCCRLRVRGVLATRYRDAGTSGVRRRAADGSWSSSSGSSNRFEQGIGTVVSVIISKLGGGRFR